MDIQTIIEQQRKFSDSGIAKDIRFRKQQLKKLREVLKQNEELLYQAIYSDIKKSKFEAYLTELTLVYQEIELALKNVARWSKTKKVTTGIANFPGKSFIIPEPYGTTLIIGAWNYPFQLTLGPLIAAMAG